MDEAQWVELPPDADGDSRFWRVGYVEFFSKRTVSRITLQQDVAGMYGNMWRVCVWDGEQIIAEIPRHNAQAIGYA